MRCRTEYVAGTKPKRRRAQKRKNSSESHTLSKLKSYQCARRVSYLRVVPPPPVDPPSSSENSHALDDSFQGCFFSDSPPNTPPSSSSSPLVLSSATLLQSETPIVVFDRARKLEVHICDPEYIQKSARYRHIKTIYRGNSFENLKMIKARLWRL